MVSYQGVATSIPKLHKYMINILMRVTILIMQDDGINANLIYTASLCSYNDESSTCYFCAISS